MAKAILICGRLCSGKSTYAAGLCGQGRILISVDELMLDMLEPYLGEMHEVYTARAEKYLLRKAVEITSAGCDVVLDWGFWSKARRKEIKKFFCSAGIPREMHYIDISDREWHRRLDRRNRLVAQSQASAYYVDENLAAKFESKFEKPDRNEIDVWITQ